MFIAEIGINHNGNLDLAKEMILMAKRAGADAVKFQKRNVEENITDANRNLKRKTLKGEQSYTEYKYDLEFDYKDYAEVDRFCEEVGIKWTASVWDIPSVDFIKKFDIPFIKIPSARINELDLIEEINKTNIPVILSIGMSDEEEAAAAIDKVKNLQAIMYCKGAYPPPDEDLNLNTIIYLKEKYPNIKIGYSSHDSSIYPVVFSSILGAELYEVHVTLNRKMYGSDQKCSFEEEELTSMINLIKKGKIWLGESKIECLESERPFRDKLRR